MSVDPATGNLALIVRTDKHYELGHLENPAGRATYRTLAISPAEVDQPSWSPSGHTVSYRQAAPEGRTMMVRTLRAGVPRPLCSLKEGDETLWLDEHTVAVVRWDRIAREEVPE